MPVTLTGGYLCLVFTIQDGERANEWDPGPRDKNTFFFGYG